ncbi:MAG: aldolase catalytic domain-containing protein, partial [Clostridia bacterium]|nr:aldolase catalytic domain-containing protein [Clostridia bacterium]
MAETGNLLSYRKDIKLLDATLRDGGLVNNFEFSDEFVKALYQANVAAGVDFMEFGYKADKDIFDETKFGKWKFCKEDDIFAIVGEKNTKLKIACMADVGRTNCVRDIGEKANSPIDMYRVATYINTIPSAIEIIEHCNKMGYKTTCNIMAVSTSSDKEIDMALDMLGKSCVDGIYIVDSYGSFYPEETRALAKRYVECGEKYGKFIGVHAHDNHGLAFANTIDSIACGVNYADATVASMGRGAGNCALEQMLLFLTNPSYKLMPILKFIEKYMRPLKESGVKWGYGIQYLLTGFFNQHPRAAIDFTNQNRDDFTNFFTE